MRFFAICVLLSFISQFMSICSGQYAQTAKLYDDMGCLGVSQDITNKFSVFPDLDGTWDNRAESVMLVGMWVFYDNKNQNLGGNGYMEFIFEPKLKCVDFDRSFLNKTTSAYISSYLYAGDQASYRSDTLTVFTQIFFQGKFQLIRNDLARLDNTKIRSLIATGSPSVGWSLYPQANFGGAPVCVFPPEESKDFEPVMLEDLRDLGIRVASVKKGCQIPKSRKLEIKKPHRIGGVEIHGVGNRKNMKPDNK